MWYRKTMCVASVEPSRYLTNNIRHRACFATDSLLPRRLGSHVEASARASKLFRLALSRLCELVRACCHRAVQCIAANYALKRVTVPASRQVQVTSVPHRARVRAYTLARTHARSLICAAPSGQAARQPASLSASSTNDGDDEEQTDKATDRVCTSEHTRDV